MTSGAKGGAYNMDKLAEYNANAMNDFNDKVLEPCPNCGRTFLPDRLQIHLRSCKQNAGLKNKVAALNAQNASSSSLPEISQKTQAAKRTEPCSLCGAEINKSSMPIHMMNCQKRQERAAMAGGGSPPAVRQGALEDLDNNNPYSQTTKKQPMNSRNA